MTPPLIYLAAPFSAPDVRQEHHRFMEVNRMAGLIINSGLHVFSPISHCYPIFRAAHHFIHGDYTFWSSYNHRMIDHSDEFWIFTMLGWQNSLGVKGELKHALNRGKPLYLVAFDLTRNDYIKTLHTT